MKKNNKGFSLVELLIAIAVSGIILTALVILVAQSVQGYTKQTMVSQMMNEIDLTLNQVGVEIMEADGIYISSDTDGKRGVYVDNVIDKSEGDPELYKHPCGYILEDRVLYYIDENNEKSEVCDHIDDFKVSIDRDSFVLETDGTIKKVDYNPRFIVEITMSKANITRTVRRVFKSRNDVSSTMYVDVMSTTEKEEDGEIKQYNVSTKTHIAKGVSVNGLGSFVTE